jgi:hypothetical protein
MDSPADGDELARVVPLRRRDRELITAPAARGSLPRERAPFDPEIEAGDLAPPTADPWRAAAARLSRSPLRFGRGPSSQDDARAVASWRPSRSLLLAAAGAGLATIAVFALAVFILNPSTPTPPAHVGSSGRGAAAGALAAVETSLLWGSSSPFGVIGHSAAQEAAASRAMRPRRGGTKSTKPTSSRSHARGRALSINHQPVVVASYSPATSTTASRAGAAGTQHSVVTTSTQHSVSVSTGQRASSPSTPSSGSGSSSNRPAFGDQGLLGPGSSPDS